MGWELTVHRQNAGFSVNVRKAKEAREVPPAQLASATKMMECLWGPNERIISGEKLSEGGQNRGLLKYATTNGHHFVQKLSSSGVEIRVVQEIIRRQVDQQNVVSAPVPRMLDLLEGPHCSEIFMEWHTPCRRKDLSSDSFAEEVGYLGFALERYLSQLSLPFESETPPTDELRDLLGRLGESPPPSLDKIEHLLRGQRTVLGHGDLNWSNVLRHRDDGRLLGIDFAEVRAYYPGASLFNFGRGTTNRFQKRMLEAYLRASQYCQPETHMAFYLRLTVFNLRQGFYFHRGTGSLAQRFKHDYAKVERAFSNVE